MFSHGSKPRKQQHRRVFSIYTMNKVLKAICIHIFNDSVWGTFNLSKHEEISFDSLEYLFLEFQEWTLWIAVGVKNRRWRICISNM